MKRLVLLVCLTFSASSFASDVCNEIKYRGFQGPLMNCVFSGMSAREIGPGVYCDLPKVIDAKGDLMGFLRNTESSTSLTNIKIKVVTIGSDESFEISQLRATSNKTVRDLSAMYGSIICGGEEKFVKCEDELRDRTQLLASLMQNISGLTQQQLSDLKKGIYNGSKIKGIWFNFGVDISKLNRCGVE